MTHLKFAAASLAALLALPTLALADDKPKPDTAAITRQAWEAAVKVSTLGPSDITIVDQAKLHLPPGMLFIPQREANALIMSWGNTTDDQLVGLVVPEDGSQAWSIPIDQVKDGHVSDEEAKQWNADDLLKSIKEGTEADNKDRIERGFTAIEIVGWQQAPSYDAAAHKLVWALKSQDVGAAADDNKGINYNTYALGRDGYFKLDLLTDEQNFEHDKALGQQVLAAFDYNQGKRYEDFNASTDHLAEYGIAALVGGIAAKKLGLIALAGVFVLKFIKVIGVAVVVALGALKRFFSGRKTPSA